MDKLGVSQDKKIVNDDIIIGPMAVNKNEGGTYQHTANSTRLSCADFMAAGLLSKRRGGASAAIFGYFRFYKEEKGRRGEKNHRI